MVHPRATLTPRDDCFWFGAWRNSAGPRPRWPKRPAFRGRRCTNGSVGSEPRVSWVCRTGPPGQSDHPGPCPPTRSRGSSSCGVVSSAGRIGSLRCWDIRGRPSTPCCAGTAALGCVTSTVSAARPLRYVRQQPGELVHMDVKKLGVIPPGGGKRILGFALAARRHRARAMTAFTSRSMTPPESPSWRCSATNRNGQRSNLSRPRIGSSPKTAFGFNAS